MQIVSHDITDRETWLAWRTANVGASEIGALFDEHPFLTALRLYVEKRGLEFPKHENAAMRRGRLLESAVAAAVEDERPHWKLHKANRYFVAPDLRLAATPDFFIEHAERRDSLGVLQAKTASPAAFEREWRGGAHPPMWIVLQCLVEMMLTEADFGAVAVLRVDAYDLRCAIFDIARHAEAEARIIAAVERFWTDVDTGTEPAPDYGRDAELARILVPRETSGKVVDLTGDNELAAWLEDRAEIMENIDAATARKQEIESALRFKMGDAEYARLADWNVSYKTSHRKETIIPAKDIRTLRINRRKARPHERNRETTAPDDSAA